MRLWVDSDAAGSAGRAVRAKVKEQVAVINRKALSRGTRAVNALRSAELKVLQGQRSGRKYRKPYTGSKTREERKKSGYKPPMYTASAPGEAPARRTGNLRMHWNGRVVPACSSKGIEVIAQLESHEKYAVYLEKGAGMAPRPFVEKIKEEAMPEIEKIYSELYT